MQVEVFKRADQDQLKDIFSKVRIVDFFSIVLIMDVDGPWGLKILTLKFDLGITLPICSNSGNDSKQDF